MGILFGREDNGLYNAEVAKADRLLTIDSDPSFYSLNLGQAVLLVAYQLYRGRARRRAVTPAPRRASKGEQAQLLDELLGALEARGHWGASNREAGQVGGWGWLVHVQGGAVVVWCACGGAAAAVCMLRGCCCCVHACHACWGDCTACCAPAGS